RSLAPFLRPSPVASEFRPPTPPEGGPFEPGPQFGPPPGRREPAASPPEPRFAPRPQPRRGGFVRNVVMHARFNGPVYWIIVSMVRALTYYRRSQERERKAIELENRLTQAKLHALRMQLHPHFL